MRIIGILFLVFMSYLFLKSVLSLMNLSKSQKEKGRRISERQGGKIVEDPVCHTYIPKATALKRNILGEDVYFCGKKCAEAYSKDP